MKIERFDEITGRYPQLRLAVVGDFCLDRYLEIDPGKQEISLETNLPVYNVVRVRAQPGGAGTVLNNLVALGIGTLYPVGFAGQDGEGYELSQALAALPGIRLDHFLQTEERHTFTYCKPLIVEAGKSPRELNRLDQKNWTPTPPALTQQLANAVSTLSRSTDGFALLSQVDVPETGVLTRQVLDTVGQLARANPRHVMIADSRHSLRGFPPVIFKMNGAELAALTNAGNLASIPQAKDAAKTLAKQNDRPVFVTLAERGIVGALPDGQCEHVLSLPLRGEIDIVGAGDSVTANLTAALAAGAELREAIELANAAASIVIHQLGTTGTASRAQLRSLMFGNQAERR